MDASGTWYSEEADKFGGRSVITRCVDRYKREDSGVLDVTHSFAMSRIWHRQLTATHRVARIICIAILLFGATSNSSASPLPVEQITIPELNQSSTTIESLLNHNASNSTTNDLYVIKAVVYEIGILTDVDNSTNDTTERHEEVNLSFYDPPHRKDGLLDLSGIPVPKVVATTNNDKQYE